LIDYAIDHKKLPSVTRKIYNKRLAGVSVGGRKGNKVRESMLYNNDPTKTATKAITRPLPTELGIAPPLSVLLPAVLPLLGVEGVLVVVPLRVLARVWNEVKLR